MFNIVSPNLVFPRLYPEVEHKEPTVEDKGWDKIGDFVLRDKVDFMPQIGMQEQMAKCTSNLVFACGAGTSGKAQPYDAKVLTPNGFVNMGSLKVGDTIMGADGKPQSVLKIFEQGEKDVYCVTFDDGAQTECCKEHLWTVSVRRESTRRGYGTQRTMQLQDIVPILESGDKVAIPMCSPIEFAPSLYPVDPYLLGLLIGDGHMRRGNTLFSTKDSELLEYMSSIGCHVRYRGAGCDYQISGGALTRELRGLGLQGKKPDAKFIPYMYKYADVETRLAILQGLMDTDGTVGKNGSMTYYTVSPKLAEDVQWVVRSLGGRCSISEKHPKYIYKGEKKQGKVCYVLSICTEKNTQLCRLKRKTERAFDGVRYGKTILRRTFKSVEYVGKKVCRCILVSNPDSLYVTDDFIVTHNTFALMLSAMKGLGRRDYSARLISVRLQDSKKGSSIFRDAMALWGNFAGCQVSTSDYPTFFWPQWNNSIQLVHSNYNVENPAEWEAFQDYAKKVQASFIAVDEATEMKSFKMFLMWMMRNRDDSGMTPQMLFTFNPVYDHYTTKMLRDAGCLGDDHYLKPEMVGKELYFYIKGDTVDSIVWGRTREEVVRRVGGIEVSAKERKLGLTEEDMVKSFTVLTGEAADNMKLVSSTKGGSIGNLHAMGETLRSVNKGAYFGPVEKEELNITRQMIYNMWNTAEDDDDDEMYATMDVSGAKNKNDLCQMVIWKGHKIIAVPVYTGGDMKQLVSWINEQLQKYGVPVENFAFDATGIGYYLKDFTTGYPVTGNKRAVQEFDEYGNAINMEMYYNLRSQMFGKMKVLFEKGEISCALDQNTLLPHGRKGQKRELIEILFDEMNLFISVIRNNKIYYKSKEEFKAKYHFSPDLMDSIILRAVFDFTAKKKKTAVQEYDDDDDFLDLYRGPGSRMIS